MRKVCGMSAVIHPAFGNADAIRAAQAGTAAFQRALDLGYSTSAAFDFAREAKREASHWESPEHTALRVVHPKRGTFAGNPGGHT